MKTWGIIKGSIFTIIGLCAAVYLMLYFGLPFFFNKQDYSSLITKNIKAKTGLVLLIDNYNLSVSPSLNIKLKADNIGLFYPNKIQILDVKKTEADFSLFTFLKKELRLKNFKAKKIQFSTKLLSDGKTTFQKYVEDNIKDCDDFKFSRTLPNIFVDEYVIKIKDEKSGKRVKLTGSGLNAYQNADYRYFSFVTSGELFVSDKKMVTYKTKLDIPKDLLKQNEINLSDFNIERLTAQDFSANLSADLKLHSKNAKFDYASGKIDVDNFILKIGSIVLPPSCFSIKTDKQKAFLVSKFYTNKNEASDIKADIALKKPYSANVKCTCPTAQISNLQAIAVAVSDLLNIKNNLSEFKASGTVSADFSAYIDDKNLKSNGQFVIKNAKFVHKKVPLNISGVNAFVDFSDNNIVIKKSVALVNNQPVKITGNIKSDATGNLRISAENLDLNHIVNAFPFFKFDKNIVLKSGKLSFDTTITGKLQEISPVVNAVIKNLSGKISSIKSDFEIREINVNSKITKNGVNGTVLLNALKLHSSQIAYGKVLSSDKISASFDEKIITINPSKLTTGDANLTLSGGVKNYSKKPDISMKMMGTIDTRFLKSLLGNEISLFNKGYLPLNAYINATPETLLFDLKLLANSSNYITPIMTRSFKNKNTLTHIQGSLIKNKLHIKDFGIFYAPNLNSLVTEPNMSTLKRIVSVNGSVSDVNSSSIALESVHISTNEPIELELPNFANSSAQVFADVVLSGVLPSKILTNGTLQISNLSIPSAGLSSSLANINLKNNLIAAKIDSLKIGDTNLGIEAILPSDVLETNKIQNLIVNANFIDLEKIMELAQKMFPASYAPGVNIPYDIELGKINIKSFKLDTIKAQNIVADFTQKKNVLTLKNLFANSYGGKVAGNLNYNLLYNTLDAKLQGRGLNVASAAADFLPKEENVSGSLDFDADISATGTNLKQQLSSMKGNADILIRNGHFGQLGRFEHFLYAQNLISQKLIYASLNSAKQAISPKDTGRFTYLKGKLKFSGGFAHLNPVMTAGAQMSMYITGRINLLNENVDLRILGKVSSEISSSLGLLGKLTIKDFLDEHTKYGQSVAKLFNSYNAEIPELDISKIPNLSPDMKYQTKNFLVLIQGVATSVKAVKSFSWVNPLGSKRNLLNQSQNGSDDMQIAPVSNQIPSNNNQMLPNDNPSKPSPDFLDNIPDDFN